VCQCALFLCDRHKLPAVEPPRPLLEDLQFGPLANFQRSLAGANFAAAGLQGPHGYGNFNPSTFHCSFCFCDIAVVTINSFHCDSVGVNACWAYCCLHTFSALMLLVGHQKGLLVYKKNDWWGASVVICLWWGADLHTAQLMPLPFTDSGFSKSRLVLSLWYWLTWVVLDTKRPLNGCCCCRFVLRLVKACWFRTFRHGQLSHCHSTK